MSPPPTRAFIRDAVASNTDECIDWPFARNQKGYGRVHFQGRNAFATHVALLLSGEPRPTLPSGRPAIALHSCDNPPCVNPNHLRWGSPEDNVRDQMERGRLVVGEQMPHSKLNASAVRVIRRRVANGETYARLAEEYGVHQSIIGRAATGSNWRHVDAGAGGSAA